MFIATYNIFHIVAALVFLNALPSVITTDDTNNFDICDMTGNKDKFKEGILGEVGEFPWLGVLRVPMQQLDQPDKPLTIAATGAVLVTVKHVAVNADDISQASKDRLRTSGSVYFMPEANKTWSCKLKDFIIHPEYEYATLNTIALVELDLDLVYDDEQYRADIKPICWPGSAFNKTNALYVAGFTDERMLLEKVLYKAQYVPKNTCDEFYKRTYLKADKMQDPKFYVCTIAVIKKEVCQWDNGMVLLSNVTGHWSLVGFGVAGPGCSAPTRFLDMSAYTDWIQSASRDPQTYDYYGGKQIDTFY